MKSNELVLNNLGLARWVAWRYTRRAPHLEFDDVYQTAACALVYSASKWDSTRNVKFSAFAVPYMFQVVRAYLGIGKPPVHHVDIDEAYGLGVPPNAEDHVFLGEVRECLDSLRTCKCPPGPKRDTNFAVDALLDQVENGFGSVSALAATTGKDQRFIQKQVIWAREQLRERFKEAA